MTDVANITDFNALSAAQKSYFIDEQVDEVVKKLDERELNKLIRSIILDRSENNYIRKKAIEIFTECVFLKKLKARNELGILIEEWEEVEEVYLELRRLKDLFLLYDEDPDAIEKIYQGSTENDEAEIAAEAYYHLGLIAMQKAFLSDSSDQCLLSLEEGKALFNKSSAAIENRIDANFFETVISLILDFLKETHGGIKEKLQSLSGILLKQDLFSFSAKPSYFHISFYRSLVNLNEIRKKTESASEWLDFRNELNILFHYYNEIKNSELQTRLNYSVLNKIFLEFIENNAVEPYFASSLTAELIRINARLAEPNLAAEEQEFLLYIKELAESADSKKKEVESIRQRVINAFPERDVVQIDAALSKVKDPTNAHELIQVYDILAKPSWERFIDALTNACLNLQGAKIFWTATEDERNSHIASILEASGHTIKDQTRWGISRGGKAPGEIDIFVRESDGTPFTITEALIINSLDQAYIKLHIDKLFKYDTSGLERNFILIYSEAKNFQGLWEKYVEFIKNHTYEYQFIDFEVVNNKFADLKIGKTSHLRNGKKVFLYHFMLNLNLK